MSTSHCNDPALSIRLFGTFDIRIHGAPLPKLRSRKEKWLLALLVLERGRDVARTKLAQALWPFPDHSVDQAAYNLRRSLTELRKALGSEVHRLQSPEPHLLRFDLENAEVDLTAFDAALERGDTASLEQAVALYAGPLLWECTESWAAREREQRETAYLKTLETLSARAVADGDYEAAERWLRSAVAVDPLRDPAQRALMDVLAKSGDSNAAIQVYQQFSRQLHRDRNAVPAPETTALFASIRAGQRSGARTPPLPDAAPFAATPRRIPLPLTTLVGREEHVREVATRLRLARLLTLTGAGGVGKTRLAIELAEELAEDYADGVWFADMGALTDPGLVTQTVASVLEVREELGRPLLETLGEALASRQLLLVLDGCEHLIAACAALAESLLRGCRHVRLLATSRQPLEVSGEAVWRVPSLSAPDPGKLPSEDATLPDFLQSYAAIHLFAARAALVQPDFEIKPQNARAVAQICWRLDGSPLAIELAAARVKAMPVGQISRRLDQLFRLLTGGPRTALSRQQTLEATMDWSYNLLSEEERSLLRRLSVFAGGWSLEAAEAVCSGKGIAGEEVLDLLTRLVDKSLVVYEELEGLARYRFLETVRQYSREKLSATEETERVGAQHLDFFIRLADAISPTLILGDAEAQLDRLDAEHDNLRAALAWATAADRDTEALQLAGALWRFWNRRAYLSEGRAYLENVLTKSKALLPTAERVRACNGAGFLAFQLGDNRAAAAHFAESLHIGELLGDKALLASTHYCQGYMAWYWADHAVARGFYEQALALQREAENREEYALTLCHLGIVESDLGDYESAQAHFAESLLIGRELGNRTLIANSLHSQAHMALYRGDHATARTLYEQTLLLGQELKDRMRIAISLHRLGNVAYAIQDYTRAQQHFEESLALARMLAEKRLIAAALYGCGTTASARGEYSRAEDNLKECIALSQYLRDSRSIVRALSALAEVADVQAHRMQAAALREAVARLQNGLLKTPSQSHPQPNNAAPHSQILGQKITSTQGFQEDLLTLDEVIRSALEMGN